jgi:hypothetical protein
MAYIIADSFKFGGQADTVLQAATKEAMQAAQQGDLAGVFKAQGIMTNGTVSVGAIASTIASMNQGYQGAANKS